MRGCPKTPRSTNRRVAYFRGEQRHHKVGFHCMRVLLLTAYLPPETDPATHLSSI